MSRVCVSVCKCLAMFVCWRVSAFVYCVAVRVLVCVYACISKWVCAVFHYVLVLYAFVCLFSVLARQCVLVLVCLFSCVDLGLFFMVSVCLCLCQSGLVFM